MAERGLGNHRQKQKADGETGISEARMAAAASCEKVVIILSDRDSNRIGRQESLRRPIRMQRRRAAEAPGGSPLTRTLNRLTARAPFGPG